MTRIDMSRMNQEFTIMTWISSKANTKRDEDTEVTSNRSCVGDVVRGSLVEAFHNRIRKPSARLASTNRSLHRLTAGRVSVLFNSDRRLSLVQASPIAS
jgi:hypothetical protein